MDTRVCNKCLVEQLLEEFPPALGCKEGRRWSCKVCTSLTKAAYYMTNRGTIRAQHYLYFLSHHEELLAYGATYRAIHRVELRMAAKIYKTSHKEQYRAYNVAHAVEISLRRAVYNAAHQIKNKVYSMFYKATHKEAIPPLSPVQPLLLTLSPSRRLQVNGQ